MQAWEGFVEGEAEANKAAAAGAKALEAKAVPVSRHVECDGGWD